MALSKINLKSLEAALHSDILDKLGEKFKMVFVIEAFLEGYGETYTGCFSTEIFDFAKAVEAFNKIKNCPTFEEVQFRAYGFYGDSIYNGKYDILEISRPNGKSTMREVSNNLYDYVA